jgi:predicted secreted protein
MEWTSVVAIYALFWVMTAFVMLPFGIKTHDEAGLPKIPGQADSAPVGFRPGRHALRATVIAAALTTIYVANYVYGWVTVDALNIFPDPPSQR